MKNGSFVSLKLAAAGIFSVTALISASAADAKLTPQELQFFESKIRPIFADYCYKCHSPGGEKIKGGLSLDTREGLLKGGDTGPALVAGNPDKSLLIRAVRYKEQDLQMPPSDKKLPANLIADLEAWVKMGAPDPRSGAAAKVEYKVDFAKARQHWAFKAVVKPAVPAPADASGWVKTPIDAFALAKMTEKGLTPSPQADKTTLMRRATFDLTGLPPSSKELDEFLADNSANAFEKVVDRLLSSPHYGERWGRHWLDLSKYGETKGATAQRDNRYVYAYSYRDWVIKAFNDDLPYDRFLTLQIAGDKLALPENEQPHLAAMGFLTLGNRFNGSVNDIIDDRIDLLGKTTMGLTLACTRCHDHKFDPLQQKDYYALHGIFNSSAEPAEGPMVEKPKSEALYKQFLGELERTKEEERKWFADYGAQQSVALQQKAADYWLALYDLKHSGSNTTVGVYFQRRDMNQGIGRGWEGVLKSYENKFHPVLTPWIEFSKIPPREFAAKARALSLKFAANADPAKKLNPVVARMFSIAPTAMSQVAARYNSLFSDTSRRWNAIYEPWKEARRRAAPDAKLAPEPTKLADASYEEIRQVTHGRGSPTFMDDNRVRSLAGGDNRLTGKIAGFERSLNDVKAKHPGSPARANVFEDKQRAENSAIMLRGNAATRGPVVPRQFLQILSAGDPVPFKEGSGRLELAKAIATKDNPLTPRVIVNRVWLHHFGEAIVRTPDDFGTRSEPPTHPELLDWMAATFMEQGWSIKKLHRLIMLSSVYQQSSDDDARKVQLDPDNKFLWQMNRRRLDFEALRDTILAIGGRLDLTMGGPSVRLNSEPFSTRRSVYGYVDRANLPSMFTSFDFASPDLVTGKRADTVVPQQALFMMNSSLVVEQARNLSQRADFQAEPTLEKRVEMLYRLIYQRAPRPVEKQIALDYIRGELGAAVIAPAEGEPAWLYGYGDIDPARRTLRHFISMTTFNGSWTAPTVAGDMRAPSVSLNGGGGSATGYFAVVRRWVAPRDLVVSIEGTLGHGNKDKSAVGVTARIVHSRTGQAGSTYTAFRNSVVTKIPALTVRAGDTIDFIVDVRGNPRGDSFSWAPVIKTAGAKPQEWSASKDFGGAVAPDRLNAWEKFAQILLQTNELTFIN
ncbi:MAG: PSD1 domain-containing protein [Verrucomicrobia bacterium]|nr:PSD1 domain-containing protein [Verrucomicrobiota bacterium]